MPRVSVIIAAYNAAAHLEDTLASVHAQSYDDWEVVLADDASTDATARIAKTFTERVRVVTSAQNLGPAGARNLAVANASGELLASDSLGDPAATKQVLVRDGTVMTTDGPFAEVKEQLAGFYLVDCDSIERAIEIVPQIPEAAFSIVEVRPIRDLSSLL